MNPIGCLAIICPILLCLFFIFLAIGIMGWEFFLVMIGTLIAFFLLKALVSHINTRAERLELQRIREKEQKQRKQESKQKNQGKTNNTSIPHRVTRPQSNDIDYDYYRLREMREEQAAYDDFIASLDMADDN